jgi:hypothetical protein
MPPSGTDLPVVSRPGSTSLTIDSFPRGGEGQGGGRPSNGQGCASDRFRLVVQQMPPSLAPAFLMVAVARDGRCGGARP